MAWDVWWAPIGFLLSGSCWAAQFSRGQMDRVVGGRGLGATVTSTGLGAASSSCYSAAIAFAKRVFPKGARLPADVSANGGGVVVSCFEWLPNLQQFSWDEAHVIPSLQGCIARVGGG